MAEFQLFDDTEEGYKDFLQQVHDNLLNKDTVKRAVDEAIEQVRKDVLDEDPDDIGFGAESQTERFCECLANELKRSWLL